MEERLGRKRVHCPHCDDYISKSLFYQHKHLYYDENKQEWRSNDDSIVAPASTFVSFEFSPTLDMEDGMIAVLYFICFFWTFLYSSVQPCNV